VFGVIAETLQHVQSLGAHMELGRALGLGLAAANFVLFVCEPLGTQ
jgi:hypothetical protein